MMFTIFERITWHFRKRTLIKLIDQINFEMEWITKDQDLPDDIKAQLILNMLKEIVRIESIVRSRESHRKSSGPVSTELAHPQDT